MQVDLMGYLYPDMLVELSRREKKANIKPDADIDVYMKVRSLTWIGPPYSGHHRSLKPYRKVFL